VFKEIIENENPIIFEIGANDGTDTVKFFEEFSNPTIHCFEPDEDTFKIFLENTKAFSRNIIASCLAVSNISGEADFIIADNTYSSSLKEPVEHLKIYPSVHFTHTKRVKTITLNEYSKQYNISYCDLVWMDVQGAEDLVIEGGKNFFENTKYIYSEFSNSNLYEGALNKDGILKLLPYFEIHSIITDNYVGGDFLLVNKRIE